MAAQSKKNATVRKKSTGGEQAKRAARSTTRKRAKASTRATASKKSTSGRNRSATRRPATSASGAGASKKSPRAKASDPTKRSTPSKRASGSKKATATKRADGVRRDVVSLIKADHAAVNQLFGRYSTLGGRAVRSRRRLADRLIRELSVHAAVEEQVLYPSVRVAVPNGERLVKEALSEHQALKETLAALENCQPESEEFDVLMNRARDEVRHHVKEEEASEGILGQLRKHHPSREELQRMATMTRAAKKLAPTRPHPNAPSTPPGTVIIGAATALIERARDTLTGPERR